MAADQCLEAQEEDESSSVGDKVFFVNTDAKYFVNHDLHVAYCLADAFEPSTTDWVGILPVNWHSLTQRLSFQWVPRDPTDNKEWRLRFPAADLILADSQHSYQFAYVTLASKILGRSRPFFLSCKSGTGLSVDDVELERVKEKCPSHPDLSIMKNERDCSQWPSAPSPPLSVTSAASGDHSDHSIKMNQREEESGDGSEIELGINGGLERKGYQSGRGDEDNEDGLIVIQDESDKTQESVIGQTIIPQNRLVGEHTCIHRMLWNNPQGDVDSRGDQVKEMVDSRMPMNDLNLENRINVGVDGTDETKSAFTNGPARETSDICVNSKDDRVDRTFARLTSTNLLRANHQRENKPVKIPRSVARTVRRSRPSGDVSFTQQTFPKSPDVAPSRENLQDRHSTSHSTTSSPSLDIVIDIPSDRNPQDFPKTVPRPVQIEHDVDSQTPPLEPQTQLQTSNSEINLKPKMKQIFIATGPKGKCARSWPFINDRIELEDDEGDPFKTESSSEHLVSYVLRYLAEHRPDPSSTDNLKPCRICGHLAMELSAMRWRTAQVEYREKALVLQMLKMTKHYRQQDDLLVHMHQITQENSDLAKINDRLRQQVSNMKDVLLTNHKLSQEKENLEKKVGDLMWEKASLCSKIQMQQQGEVRVARRAAELNSALVEAQEELHRLFGQQQLLQRFVDGLLATLSGLGFTAITDPGGRRLLLDLPGIPALELEPLADNHIAAKKPRRCRPTDKWYKAMLAAQEETIHRLQQDLRVWESARGNQQETGTMFHQLQRALHAEMERNRNLERQTQQLARLLEQASQAIEIHTNGKESKRSRSHDKARIVREPWFTQQPTSTGGSDYVSQGARPKTQLHGRRSWDVCSPDEAEGDSGDNTIETSNVDYVTPGDSHEDLGDCCPHCKEPFAPNLSVDARQEHIRMHMYAELKNEQQGYPLLPPSCHQIHHHQVSKSKS